MHTVEFVIVEGHIGEDERCELRQNWHLEMRVEGHRYPIATARAWTLDGASSELAHHLKQLLDRRTPA